MPKGIYFLLFGRIHIIGNVNQNPKGFPFRKLSPGSFFGECLFLKESSQFDIVFGFYKKINEIFFF